LIERRWRQVLDDAGRFLDRWGNLACELGWSAADLFAVHPQALDTRRDIQGLCWLLAGRWVAAITRDSARIELSRSGSQTYRRHSARGGVVIWELQDRPIAKPLRETCAFEADILEGDVR
jgi:hypothetical protein